MGEQVHNLQELQSLITQFIPLSKFIFIERINVLLGLGEQCCCCSLLEDSE